MKQFVTFWKCFMTPIFTKTDVKFWKLIVFPKRNTLSFQKIHQFVVTLLWLSTYYKQSPCPGSRHGYPYTKKNNKKEKIKEKQKEIEKEEIEKTK